MIKFYNMSNVQLFLILELYWKCTDLAQSEKKVQFLIFYKQSQKNVFLIKENELYGNLERKYRVI